MPVSPIRLFMLLDAVTGVANKRALAQITKHGFIFWVSGIHGVFILHS
jgi:hypothetical protein